MPNSCNLSFDGAAQLRRRTDRGGYHKVRAGLDKDGAIVAWDHHIVAQQIMEGTSFEGFTVRNGVDMTTTEGAADMPYAVPNIAIAGAQNRW